MKLSDLERRAARAAADRLPRRFDAQRRAGALRRPDRGERRQASSCAPPTWSRRSASRSPPRSRARARSCCRRGCCSTSPAASRRGTAGDARAAARAAGRRGRRPAPRSFHLRTLRTEDFPPLPEPGGDTVVTCPPTAFVDTIEKVSRSASRDETRPILTGILVSASGAELRMVATDSYRLSVKETDARGAARRRLRGQRPGARARRAAVGRRRPARPRTIRIGVRANQVVFEVGGVGALARG